MNSRLPLTTEAIKIAQVVAKNNPPRSNWRNSERLDNAGIPQYKWIRLNSYYSIKVAPGRFGCVAWGEYLGQPCNGMALLRKIKKAAQ